MNLDNNEKKRRQFELGNVKKEHLYKIALQVGYDGPKRSKEEIYKCLYSIDKDKFNNICRQYVNAENSTNYLFIMDEETSQKLKKETFLILRKLPKTPDSEENSIFLDNSYFSTEDDTYSIRLNQIKMNRVFRTWNFEKKKWNLKKQTN